MLYVNGRRRALTRFPRTEETIVWNGKVGGRPVRAGVYSLQLAAFDPAGNLADRTPPVRVVVRYVALGRTRIAVAAGAPLRGPRLVRCPARPLDARRPQRLRARPARSGCARRCRRAASR